MDYFSDGLPTGDYFRALGPWLCPQLLLSNMHHEKCALELFKVQGHTFHGKTGVVPPQCPPLMKFPSPAHAPGQGSGDYFMESSTSRMLKPIIHENRNHLNNTLRYCIKYDRLYTHFGHD